MSANVSCPHCNGLIENDPELAGQEVSCPFCNALLVMPQVVTPPPRRTAVVEPAPIIYAPSNTSSVINRLRKKQPPKWAKIALGCVAGLLVLRGCIAGMGGGSNHQMLSDVSGVWQAVSDGTIVTINLTGNSKFIQLGNGQRIPFSIKDIDADENTIALIGKTVNGDSVVWTIQQNWDAKGEYFTLILITHTGQSDELDFVRRL